MKDSLTLLGTGDSMGVPRVYCDCEVCSEARSTGRNRRYRSSALLRTDQGSLLIDCGPDWTDQMNNCGIRQTTDVLITHAHHDHVGGLPEWADACRWLSVKGRLYAPVEVLQTIRSRYPWIESVITFNDVKQQLTFGDWTISPWKVNHGKNGHAYAYRFESAAFNWVYCPDSIALTAEQKAPLANLDLLVLGTAFYQEPFEVSTRSLYDMIEAQQLLEEVKPVEAWFTHMSHGVDLGAGYSLHPSIKLAETGMAFLFSKG